MSIVITFGDTLPDGRYDAPHGCSGQIVRRGLAIRWARPIEEHVLFAMKFQIRLRGVELEQSFMIRDFGE